MSSTNDLADITPLLNPQDFEEHTGGPKGKGKFRDDAPTDDTQLDMDLLDQMHGGDRREMAELMLEYRNGILDDETLDEYLEEDATARFLPWHLDQDSVDQPGPSGSSTSESSEPSHRGGWINYFLGSRH